MASDHTAMVGFGMSSRLLEPLSNVPWPSGEDEERERSAPVRPPFDEVPDRHADKRPEESRPKAPQHHPEENDSDRSNKDDDRGKHIEDPHKKQKLCRESDVSNAKIREPPDPILFALQGKNAMAKELPSDGDAEHPHCL